ncbi:MAG TPA: YraN family protein [Firmicutes bacterium]|nr:YraN family protein [Candidatus Fermentithermobacillaceae bacterium]
MNKQETGPHNVGYVIEGYACDYLKRNKYRIICRNYRSRYGEIDIVATDESALVFVEVRYRRRGSLVTPEESVSRAKIRRLKLAVRDFLWKHSGMAGNHSSIRVDLCCVTDPGEASQEGGEFDFKVIKGIIQF